MWHEKAKSKMSMCICCNPAGVYQQRRRSLSFFHSFTHFFSYFLFVIFIFWYSHWKIDPPWSELWFVFCCGTVGTLIKAHRTRTLPKFLSNSMGTKCQRKKIWLVSWDGDTFFIVSKTMTNKRSIRQIQFKINLTPVIVVVDIHQFS